MPQEKPPEPSQEARESMDTCTDDTSWVFVQETGEKWVVSVWDDRVDYVDAQKRGWQWEPDPRPERKGRMHASTKIKKPALTPEQREKRGYYGKEPVKKGQETPIVPTTRGMQHALKEPCLECPFRRDVPAGYLGGYTPEMYLKAVKSPASLACHKSAGFHEGVIETQRHCTGLAAFRANIGWVASIQHPEVPGRVFLVPTQAHESTKIVGSDSDTYFATEQEFYDHHKKGQE